MLLQRLDPRALTPKLTIDRQRVRLFPNSRPLAVDLVEFLLTFENQVIELVELFQHVFGHALCRFGLLHLASDVRSFAPAVFDLQCGFEKFPTMLFGGDPALNVGKLLAHHRQVGGEFAPSAAGVGAVFDLRRQTVAFMQELFEGRANLLGTGDGVSSRFQFVHHIHERNAVEATGQSIKLLGGIRIIEGREFLQFTQSDREHVVEYRLVQFGEQRVQEMVALQAAIARENVERAAIVRVIGVRTLTNDIVLAVHAADLELTASNTAVNRPRILMPLARVAVKNGAHELHQRGFTRFVGAVENREVLTQLIDGQVAPDSKPVDLYVRDFHCFRSCSKAGKEALRIWSQQVAAQNGHIAQYLFAFRCIAELCTTPECIGLRPFFQKFAKIKRQIVRLHSAYRTQEISEYRVFFVPGCRQVFRDTRVDVDGPYRWSPS